MVPPIEQSDKKNSDLFREIYTRRRRRTLSVKHSILKWSKHFFFPSLGRLINGIKVTATTLSPSHTHTHKHVPLPPHIYIYTYTYTPTNNTYLRQSANMGGGHIHKRKKQTNKQSWPNFKHESHTRKKKKLLLPLLYKVHGTWGGGIPNWILATYGLPEPPPQGRCTSSSSIVDEHQRKKVSVCANNNKCRTAPHHMAPKSLIIMQSWMHGVFPKCPKE